MYVLYFDINIKLCYLEKINLLTNSLNIYKTMIMIIYYIFNYRFTQDKHFIFILVIFISNLFIFLNFLVTCFMYTRKRLKIP